MPFSQFDKAYVDFFADSAVDDHFTDAEHKLYGGLFERLQWTSKAPTGLDRATGYRSEAETEAWLRTRFPEFA